MILKKGREFTAPPLLGNYLHRTKNNRVTLLRGKYKGAYLDTIPVGYVGQFLLTQCREDMTTEEIKLCEAHAGDAIMKKIRRKNKMTIKNKVQVQVEAGKGIAEAFDIAAKHGCAEIALTIPVPNSYKKPTVFDKLRTRGTPLELIGSYISAGYRERARQILEGCVLEALYERLVEKYSATCTFQNQENLTLENNIYIATLKTDRQSVALGVQDEEFVKNNPQKAPVEILNFKEQTGTVTDSIQTTILTLIESTIQLIEQTVDAALTTYNTLSNTNELTFTLIPDMSIINLHTSSTQYKLIYISGSIALYSTAKTQN